MRWYYWTDNYSSWYKTDSKKYSLVPYCKRNKSNGIKTPMRAKTRKGCWI